MSFTSYLHEIFTKINIQLLEMNTIIVILLLLGILYLLLSSIKRIREHLIKIGGLFLVTGITLYSNYWVTYLIGILIIGTTITKLEFLKDIAAIVMRGGEYWKHKRITQGSIDSKVVKYKKPQRSAMEYKILNTIWTLQIIKWPDLENRTTFYMKPNHPDYSMYREAGSKLIGEGLILETGNKHYVLSDVGFQYCIDHNSEFPIDNWYPEEKIDKEIYEYVMKKYPKTSI